MNLTQQEPTPTLTASPFGEKDSGGTASAPGQRLMSLDVYRGLIMISLAFSGFGLAATANRHLAATARDSQAGSPSIAALASNEWFWSAVRSQFDHREWVGCSYWDLVQPSFMFMVGVAMAFSYEKRRQAGNSQTRMLVHVVRRSVILILLGVFLGSAGSRSTEWSFVNVLTQIGLGYTFLFFFWNRTWQTQAIGAAAILVGTWLLYFFYPYAGIDVDAGAPAVGVSREWAQQHLVGVGAPWHKNANVGHAIDVRLLNAFPRSEPFAYNSGGYATLNFVPSLATIVFGLMAGGVLQSAKPARQKLQLLLAAGVAGLIVGQLLDFTGVCPLVKRIWTPSFAIFSAGWCSLILGALYGAIDVLGVRFSTFPFVVAGANSIVLYCMHMLMPAWIAKSLQTHFGPDVFRLQLQFGNTVLPLAGRASQSTIALYEPTIEAVIVGTVLWCVCWWMYRQKVFVRI
ncbi:MAG: DUF5009 domain-containing protein [Planctomycetes bacterium]|nr:DUF5009 domain-containing protein [Planctomycetota bacterium]